MGVPLHSSVAQVAQKTNEIICYQKLVKKQLECMNSSLTSGLIKYLVYTTNPSISNNSFCRKELGYCYEIYNISQDPDLAPCHNVLGTLISKGMLFELRRIGNSPIYTTIHADVVFRVIRGRAFEDQLDERWVGDFIIGIEETKLPDFNAVSLDQLKDLIVRFLTQNNIKQDVANKVAEAIVKGLRSTGFKSLARWQFEAIQRILDEPAQYYVVDAPTASGKTLTFMIPAIMYAILYKLKQLSGASDAQKLGALLVYPRKALQKQQLEILLKIIHHINTYLKSSLNIEVTVAVDKGKEQDESYEMKELFDIDLGGGLTGKLIQEQKRTDHTVRLVVSIKPANGSPQTLSYFKGIVITPNDRAYILSEDPDILITNPWTIRFRIKSTKTYEKDAYLNRVLIVLDEAHVYTNINYIDLVAVLKLYRDILNTVLDKKGVKAKYVLSSATIPLNDKRTLAQWIWGLCKDDNCSQIDINLNEVVLLDYSALEPDNPNKVLKVLVTLLPYRLSIETIVQGVIEVLTTALKSRPLKALLFVDSVSEVSTLAKYMNTIFDVREGAEICDHILSVSCRSSKNVTIGHNIIRNSFDNRSGVYDDYSWSHLWPISKFIGKSVAKMLEEIKNLIYMIGVHHGALREDIRREIEQNFVKGVNKILIATSTIDLGMNFDDVTFIVQYKEPISDEALIQRIGRAGRKDESYRIALAFYIPMYTPIKVQALASHATGIGSSILPHPAVIHRLYKIEFLEYELKNSLYESLLYESTIIRKLRKIAENMAIDVLRKIFSSNQVSFTLFLQVMTPSKKEYINKIKEIKTLGKQLRNLVNDIENVCKGKERFGIGAQTIASVLETWINGLNENFQEYTELDTGLILLSDSDIKNYLDKFVQEIDKWINAKPNITFIENRFIIVALPDESIIQLPLHKLQNPDKCVNTFKKLNDEINELLNKVQEIKKIMQDDMKSFTLTLFKSTLSKRLKILRSRIQKVESQKISAEQFEWVWHNVLRSYIFERLKFLVGLVTRDESDTIGLDIR